MIRNQCTHVGRDFTRRETNNGLNFQLLDEREIDGVELI